MRFLDASAFPSLAVRRRRPRPFACPHRSKRETSKSRLEPRQAWAKVHDMPDGPSRNMVGAWPCPNPPSAPLPTPLPAPIKIACVAVTKIYGRCVASVVWNKSPFGEGNGGGASAALGLSNLTGVHLKVIASWYAVEGLSRIRDRTKSRKLPRKVSRRCGPRSRSACSPVHHGTYAPGYSPASD